MSIISRLSRVDAMATLEAHEFATKYGPRFAFKALASRSLRPCLDTGGLLSLHAHHDRLLMTGTIITPDTVEMRQTAA